jgi:hypothetical protein
MTDDPNIREISEFLRKEAKLFKHVGPRAYEGWEIIHYFVRLKGQEGWRLSARRRNGKEPTENEVQWLVELAKLVSEGKATGPYRSTSSVEHVYAGIRDNITMTHYFTWDEENDYEGLEEETEDE